MVDPYVYPGTSVLRNLVGLQDADALADHEAQASTLRLAQLAALRLEGAYDLAHLQGFHRFIFQDIYSWAGELRSVPLAKPGSMFALPEHIERYAAEVLRQVNDERHLHDLPRDEFAARLTRDAPMLAAVITRLMTASTPNRPPTLHSDRGTDARPCIWSVLGGRSEATRDAQTAPVSRAIGRDGGDFGPLLWTVRCCRKVEQETGKPRDRRAGECRADELVGRFRLLTVI